MKKTASKNEHDARPAAGLSVAELKALVREVVDAALDARATPSPSKPALLTQAQLGKALGVSGRTVFEMRKRGLPSERVGDSPRFDLVAVLAWIRLQDDPVARDLLAIVTDVAQRLGKPGK